MKHVSFAIVLMATLAISCKKETVTTDAPHEKSPYRVLLFKAGDTTISSTMWAREQTVGLIIVEDDKLKAELLSYHQLPNGQGVYEIKLTNKQNCQVISRWHWEGLTIDSITPGNDVLPANTAITFTLIGDAKVGKIKVKAFGDCGNSSELVLNITMSILPVKILENVGSYDEKTKKTTIAFMIDDPMLFDWILIERNNGIEWVQAMLIASDHTTKQYNIKL